MGSKAVVSLPPIEVKNRLISPVVVRVVRSVMPVSGCQVCRELIL